MREGLGDHVFFLRLYQVCLLLLTACVVRFTLCRLMCVS